MIERSHAVLVAAFDSQLKWCAGIRDELVARGATYEVLVPRERSALSPAQVAGAGFHAVEPLPWDELVERCAGADVVVCSLAGPQAKRLCIELAARDLAPGPVVVVGWVGIIIEKITAGYLDRCGADVVAVNARHELDHFRHAAARLGIPEDNLLLTGLPFLSERPDPQRGGPVRQVLWADQPTVPASPADRHHVYRRLVEHARRHPDRTVLLKPRHRPGEDTFHRMHHDPQDLLAGLDLPPNFHVDHRPIVDLLPTTDLLLTMSSTACLEALDHGCRVALVLDLGVHERFGNHVFLDSGLLRTFDQVDDDDLGMPDPAWLDGWFAGRSGPPGRVVADRVEKLLASGERPSRVVQGSAYFRAAVELHAARTTGASPAAPGPWARRRARHGAVLGTLMHVAALWVPPVLARRARDWARSRRRAAEVREVSSRHRSPQGRPRA